LLMLVKAPLSDRMGSSGYIEDFGPDVPELTEKSSGKRSGQCLFGCGFLTLRV